MNLIITVCSGTAMSHILHYHLNHKSQHKPAALIKKSKNNTHLSTCLWVTPIKQCPLDVTAVHTDEHEICLKHKPSSGREIKESTQVHRHRYCTPSCGVAIKLMLIQTQMEIKMQICNPNASAAAWVRP